MTQWSIRLALLFAAAALVIRLLGASKSAQRAARRAWTAGCLAYLVHVGCAFHFYHHWSHWAAYDATARDTANRVGLESGAGLYVNYLFTILWVGDVIWWWLGLEAYQRRPRWLNVTWLVFF